MCCCCNLKKFYCKIIENVFKTCLEHDHFELKKWHLCQIQQQQLRQLLVLLLLFYSLFWYCFQCAVWDHSFIGGKILKFEEEKIRWIIILIKKLLIWKFFNSINFRKQSCVYRYNFRKYQFEFSFFFPQRISFQLQHFKF